MAQAAAAGSNANRVTNFVGKEVNGFAIQKLIGITLLLTHLCHRPGEVFVRVPCQASLRQCHGCP